jgi:hypothetical protein
MMTLVEEIIELVAIIEREDPIDWAMINIDENSATELIVNGIVDQYQTVWQTYDKDNQLRIMLASIAKLALENFVLNVRLRQ